MRSIESALKALADKNRLRILALLGEKKMCVCELAYVLKATQPNISKHLRKLEAVDLIRAEQDSFWTNYSVIKPPNSYLRIILEQFKKEDFHFSDLKRARKANRKNLCCKRKRK